MPKAVSVPDGLPKNLDGDMVVKIINVRIVRDQWTSIGTVGLGLGIEVEFNGQEYGQLFSMDKEVLTGSIGRILVAAGIEEVDGDTPLATFEEALVGSKYTVKQKSGKLYWYPKEG